MDSLRSRSRPLIGETTAWYDLPLLPWCRKLTPVEAGSLVDEKVGNRDISALFVDLARRGYMSIEERDKKTFIFVVKISPKSRCSSTV